MSKYEVFCPMETEYVSYISLSNFHLDHTGFRLQLQWYWKDFFEMTNIEIISKKCSFSKSQSELQWYELELPCYLINLLWDDSYSDICDDMSEFEVFSSTRSKYGSSIALSNFHLDYTWFRLELQWYWIDFLWDSWYRDNFWEMFKFEISIWTTMVWVRASVLSNKSLMRWML